MDFKITNKKLIYIVRALLYSIIAACISGLTMAFLNVFVEFIKKNSIFGLKDIFQISLSYSIIWILFGMFMGIIYSLYLLMGKKNTVMSLTSLTYLYLFLSIWFVILGYINHYYLPSPLSTHSIIWNTIIFLCGAISLILIIKFVKIRRTKSLFKYHVSILLLLFIFSYIFSLNLLGKKERQDLKGDINPNSLNVIIIVLDALRSDHLGCYGYERETTPNIDRLAAKGVIFESAYVTSSHTLESIPSLFTSVYPSTHNVQVFSSRLPKKMLLLPQIFQLHGYRTALFGNNVISEDYGYQRGIDNYYGPKSNKIGKTILISSMVSLAETGLPVVSKLLKKVLNFNDTIFKLNLPLIYGDPKEITQNINSWISDNYKSPFFIYAHYMGGHDPYKPPMPYDKMFDPNFPGDPITSPPESQSPFLPFIKGEKISPRNLENMIAQYDGQIYYHDKSLGLLFDHLKALNIDQKTVVVITSDHGEEFYDHDGHGHGHSLFDETIHIPLIISAPGINSQSHRVSDLVSSIDLFPTLLNLSGISENFEMPYEIEGMDLSSIFFTNSHPAPRKFIFCEVHQGSEIRLGSTNSIRCIRTKKYKAIIAKYEGKEERMLFDLENDPFEKNNIYGNEKELGDEFFKKIASLIKEAKEKSFKSENFIIDEKLKEKLRSLGYIK